MADGTFHPHVTLRRCFPLSGDDILLIVRVPDGDGEEHELGIVADVAQLDPESLDAVMRELRLHYFVPVIRRILEIREEFGFLYWTVETDRGQKEFITRDSVVSAAREVSTGRWLLSSMLPAALTPVASLAGRTVVVMVMFGSNPSGVWTLVVAPVSPFIRLKISA